MRRELERLTVRAAVSYMQNQNRQPGTRDYGGCIPPSRGYCEPGSSAGSFDYCIAAWHIDQKEIDRPELESAAELFIDHLLSCQHADGTIDLRETNFHCTASLAFTLQYLCDTLRLLSPRSTPFTSRMYDKLTRYIEDGTKALAASGFHTPNHRWVIASAISHCITLQEESMLNLGEERVADLQAELGRYLGEGIDMDENGEYTEKSTGIYNVACNDSLLIMARRHEHKSLLEYVRRNLDLMPAYIEPDGSLFTLKSTRQDSGSRFFPHRYYANFLEYGWLANDDQYRAVGLWLFQDGVSRNAAETRNMLTKSLVYPELIEDLPEPEPPAPAKSYFNPGFGLYRKSGETLSLTASAFATRFLKIQKGSNYIMVRLSATFYGTRGRFIPDVIHLQDEGDITLRQASEWGYTRPFDQPPNTSVWAKMDHQARERAYMDTFTAEARTVLSPRGDRAELSIGLTGPEDMLYRVDLIFPPGGTYDSAGAMVDGEEGSGLIARSSGFSYRLGNDLITVDGCFAEHFRAKGLRGGEAQDSAAFTVYCTGYVPDNRTLNFS